MAHPVDADRATNSVRDGATAASISVTLPSGIERGHLLLACARSTLVGAHTWPAGWTKIYDAADDPGDDQTSIAYRYADGTESAPSVSGANSRWISIAYRITGAEGPPQFTDINETSANTNCPALTPTTGYQDYLWIVITTRDGESQPTAGPASYVNFGAVNTGTAGSLGSNCTGGFASRQLTGISEDPGTFTASNANNDTFTVSIAPPNPRHPGINHQNPAVV